jgi:hypothetical protein
MKPDPKNFSSYEEYLKALDIYENFLDISKKTSKAIDDAKSDEELNEKMKELGFTCHEDEFCDRKYCQSNEICLWTVIESFQYDCEEHFFDGLLSEKDMILTQEDIENYCETGCRFPKEWDDENGPAYQSIMFVIDIEDAIYQSRPSHISFEGFTQQKEIKSFFRDLYMFLLIMLRQPHSDKKDRIFKNMKTFLKDNAVLSKKHSMGFLKRFSAIIGID